MSPVDIPVVMWKCRLCGTDAVCQHREIQIVFWWLSLTDWERAEHMDQYYNPKKPPMLETERPVRVLSLGSASERLKIKV